MPYRVFTLDQPMRLVLDFREVDWGAADAATLLTPGQASAVRFGVFRPGWSRMVVDLQHPLILKSAAMSRDEPSGTTVVNLHLSPARLEEFRAQTGHPNAGIWAAVPDQPAPPPPAKPSDGRLVVVLDPGHGGIDPGAQTAGLNEADLMLIFARELQERLMRSGPFQVVLTRDADVFVPLERRISIARAAGADVFISLHADALAQGQASGATVYTLSEDVSDWASQLLAERHERSDLLAGVDLSGQDDVIADVLMDLARLDTSPRADALADALAQGLQQQIGRMHKRPRQSAAFSVLKSPDIPSVLIELGFLSNQQDLDNLTSADWRAKAAEGIRQALIQWAQSDAAKRQLRRK